MAAPEVEVIFASGGSARVENTGVIREAELFVALDAQERTRMGQARGQLFVRAVCAIEVEWLFDLENTALEEREEVLWDAKRERAVASSRLMYEQLALSEAGKPGDPHDLDAAARVLAKAALGLDWAGIASLELGRLIEAVGRAGGPEALASTESMVTRLQLARESLPELGLPAVDGAYLGSLIARSLHGKFTLEDVRAMDWPSELGLALEPEARRKLDQAFPESVQLSVHRRLPIHYQLGQPPWIESRLQDFFGLKQGPAIAGGRLPLTLHLLAPNLRAVQVTRDLAGFWQRAYREIRGELSRKYPRHPWPDDPLTAPPPPPRPTRPRR
jgi:ATP-dependent helicase HrpB